MEIDIKKIQTFATLGRVLQTKHCLLRLGQRGITQRDIFFCIKEGKIIKSYPDDTPDPSCLILGLSIKKQPLHVVIGLSEQYITLITAYYPDINQWENDFQTRKEKLL